MSFKVGDIVRNKHSGRQGTITLIIGGEGVRMPLAWMGSGRERWDAWFYNLDLISRLGASPRDVQLFHIDLRIEAAVLDRRDVDASLLRNWRSIVAEASGTYEYKLQTSDGSNGGESS